MNQLWEPLPWDSQFFGKRIGRILGRIEERRLETAVAAAGESRIECLYALIEPEPEEIRTAENAGFRLVDVRLTLERKLTTADDTGVGDATRPANVNDLDSLRVIASQNHCDTRFYADPHFPRERCDDLYRTWIERSCAGWADEVLVVDTGIQAAGYVSLHDDGHGCGRIGLLGVSPTVRGRGLGRTLVSAAVSWFAHHEAKQITVVTQGRNVAAQRLYQACGFRTQSLQLWYHFWFGQPERVGE